MPLYPWWTKIDIRVLIIAWFVLRLFSYSLYFWVAEISRMKKKLGHCSLHFVAMPNPYQHGSSSASLTVLNTWVWELCVSLLGPEAKIVIYHTQKVHNCILCKSVIFFLFSLEMPTRMGKKSRQKCSRSWFRRWTCT